LEPAVKVSFLLLALVYQQVFDLRGRLRVSTEARSGFFRFFYVASSVANADPDAALTHMQNFVWATMLFTRV
jgi:hypothetical protein